MRNTALDMSILFASASVALGHGEQIQITFNPDSGRIDTREIVHTASRPAAITSLKRVYVMPLLPVVGGAGDGWYSRPNDERNAFNVPLYPSGPGVTFQYDEAAQLPGTGWSFSGSATLPNLQGTNFSYTILDGLKAWNGAAFVDPGVEQFQVMRGDGTAPPVASVTTADIGPFANLALSNIGSKSANPHSSVSYRLLGDGVSGSVAGAADGDDGVYLLSLQLNSSAAGVAPSDPFYYVMYKNTDQSTAIEAANSLGFSPSLIQVVPEPGSMALVAGIGLLALRRRRR